MPSLAAHAYTLAKRYNCDPYYHYPDDDICYTKPLSRGAVLGISIGFTLGFILFCVLFGLFLYRLMSGKWTCCTRARRSSASIQEEEEEEEYLRKQRQWDRSLAEAVRQHQMIRQHFSLYGSGAGGGGGYSSQQHSAAPVMRAANLHPAEQQQETEMPAPPRYSPPYDAPSGPLSSTLGAGNGNNTTPALNRPQRAQFKLWSRS